jgi:glycogen operon protein
MTADGSAREPARSIAALLSGADMATSDPQGGRRSDKSFLLLFNASGEEVFFVLPREGSVQGWTVVIDTAEPKVKSPPPYSPGDSALVHGHTLVVMQHEDRTAR